MDSVINSFFNTIESGLIMPVANGIWGILPVILYVAIGITLVSVAFSSSMQKGQKIAGIVGLILLAVAIHFIPDLITQAMNGSVDLSSFKAENIADQAQADRVAIRGVRLRGLRPGFDHIVRHRPRQRRGIAEWPRDFPPSASSSSTRRPKARYLPKTTNPKAVDALRCMSSSRKTA